MSDIGPGVTVTLAGIVKFVDEDGTLDVAVDGSGDGWWGEVSGIAFVKVPASSVSVSDDRLREALQRLLADEHATFIERYDANSRMYLECRYCGGADVWANDGSWSTDVHTPECAVTFAREALAVVSPDRKDEPTEVKCAVCGTLLVRTPPGVQWEHAGYAGPYLHRPSPLPESGVV